MSVNIVDMVKSQLGGGTLGKLSSFLGESEEHTQTAVGAAVPTLLAGMSHVASTPEGAQRLSSMAAKHDPSLVDNFDSALSSQGPTLVSSGSSTLSSLLGGGTASSISSVLGRFTGLKSSSTNNLLGMLTPLIFGVLGRHQRSAGLDASGLGSFLGEQKQNISSAMPTGLNSLLGSIPGLGLGASTRGTSETTYKRPVLDEVRPMRAPAHAGSGAKWGLAAVLVLGAIALVWTFSNHRESRNERAQNRTVVTEPAGSPAPTAVAVTTGLRETLNNANTTLDSITDEASAEKAIPQLDQLNGKLSNMHSTWSKLPSNSKSTTTSSLREVSSQLNSKIANLRTMPGVGTKLKPALDELESHLAGFQQTRSADGPARVGK